MTTATFLLRFLRDSSSCATAVGWGPAGADGTSTKPSGREDAACGVAICFFRSVRRNRNCLATRAGGKVAAKTTACSQSAWGKRSPGCVRVWRQCSNCPASWSSWCSACKGDSIVILTSTSSSCLHKDDCRPWTIEIHAGLSEADGVFQREAGIIAFVEFDKARQAF